MDTLVVRLVENCNSQSFWFMPVLYSVIGGLITLGGRYLLDLRKHKMTIDMLKLEHHRMINIKRIESYEQIFERYDNFLRKTLFDENYSKEVLSEFTKAIPNWNLYCSNNIRIKESALLDLCSKYVLPSKKGEYAAPLNQVLWQFVYYIRQEAYVPSLETDWYKPIDKAIFQKRIDEQVTMWENEFFKSK